MIDEQKALEILAKIAAETKPEDYDKVAEQLAKALPCSFVNELLARSDTPEGYAAYYEAIHGNRASNKIMRSIRKMFKSHGDGRGYTHVGFRGSRKSVAFGITFISWRIGLYPRKTNLLIGANDSSPEKQTQAIASIIAFHPAFKRIFPNVVPDTGKWSVEGYFVIDTSIPREKWVELQSAIIDPTFVGGGYTSTRINGKHPNGVLYTDDIHDFNNSVSQKERSTVVKTYLSVILKTAVRSADKLQTWVINVGVPWAEDDTHATLKSSGSFDYSEIPAMIRVEEGQGIYIDGVNPKNGQVYDDIVGWWELAEPEFFGVESVIFERSLGKAEFWQMIMMDIKTANTKGLRYYSYPARDIDPAWAHGAGVDWAQLAEDKPNPGRDMFGMVIGAKTPKGQLVVDDVILEQCTQAKAESHIVSAGKRYSNWRGTLVEGDGGGEVFATAVILRNPGILLHWEKTGGKNKRYRQEREMGPWLENATVMISNADTPGLEALRKALDDFPDGNNDVRDALYWLCKKFPDCLVISAPEDELPSGKRKGLKPSVWANIGAIGVK